MKDSRNSIDNALELLQSRTKPSIWSCWKSLKVDPLLFKNACVVAAKVWQIKVYTLNACGLVSYTARSSVANGAGYEREKACLPLVVCLCPDCRVAHPGATTASVDAMPYKSLVSVLVIIFRLHFLRILLMLVRYMAFDSVRICLWSSYWNMQNPHDKLPWYFVFRLTFYWEYTA